MNVADESRPRIGIVMPACDEELALPLVLAEIPKDQVDHIVVVDNASSDATAEVARAGGAQVVFEPRRGYGRACLRGLGYLLGTSEEDSLDEPLGEHDIVVFLDSDHSDYPEELPSIVGPIIAGEADLVIGSRILGGADMQALLPQAWFGNRLACFLMRIFFGARHTDLGPFRAIRVSALQRLEMQDTDFGWTVEMQLKAKTFGLRVVEIPVRYRERVGRSKITGTLWGTLRAGVKIIGWIVVWRLRLSFRSRARPTSP